jgi:polyhydroxyalkanoate synthesis regulator protein
MVARALETAYFDNSSSIARLEPAQNMMAQQEQPVPIKRYGGRRLYRLDTGRYVTQEDLAAMLKTRKKFVVADAKTGEDITDQVTPIIVEC